MSKTRKIKKTQSSKEEEAEQFSRQRSSSLESIADSFKRKREEEEEKERIQAEKEIIESFQKTKEVGSSPPNKKIKIADTKTRRRKQNTEDNPDKEMEKLIEIIEVIKRNTEDIKKENKTIISELRELKEEWERKQEEIREKEKEKRKRKRKKSNQRDNKRVRGEERGSFK